MAPFAWAIALAMIGGFLLIIGAVWLDAWLFERREERKGKR